MGSTELTEKGSRMIETLVLTAAFLVGSIPFGFLIGKLSGKDIRTEGSGNIGATNVWRICGWKYGLPAFLLDVMKGAAPVLLTIYAIKEGMIDEDVWLKSGTGLCAIVGHCFSPFLKFKGGKGVATAAGATAALLPYSFLAGITVFACVFAWKKYVSLGSLSGITTMLFTATLWERQWSWDTLPYCLFALLLSTLVWWTHRTNIGRLLRGKENKLWWSRKSQKKEETDEE